MSLVLRGITDVREGLERKNYISVDMGMERCMDGLFVTLYALNKEYFSTPKWFFEDVKRFKKIPNNCSKRIAAIVKLDDRKDIVKKVDLIFKLFKDIRKLTKKECPKMTYRNIDITINDIKEIKKLARK